MFSDEQMTGGSEGAKKPKAEWIKNAFTHSQNCGSLLCRPPSRSSSASTWKACPSHTFKLGDKLQIH